MSTSRTRQYISGIATDTASSDHPVYQLSFEVRALHTISHVFLCSIALRGLFYDCSWAVQWLAVHNRIKSFANAANETAAIPSEECKCMWTTQIEKQSNFADKRRTLLPTFYWLNSVLDKFAVKKGEKNDFHSTNVCQVIFQRRRKNRSS